MFYTDIILYDKHDVAVGTLVKATTRQVLEVMNIIGAASWFGKPQE